MGGQKEKNKENGRLPKLIIRTYEGTGGTIEDEEKAEGREVGRNQENHGRKTRR